MDKFLWAADVASSAADLQAQSPLRSIVADKEWSNIVCKHWPDWVAYKTAAKIAEHSATFWRLTRARMIEAVWGNLQR